MASHSHRDASVLVRARRELRDTDQQLADAHGLHEDRTLAVREANAKFQLKKSAAAAAEHSKSIASIQTRKTAAEKRILEETWTTTARSEEIRSCLEQVAELEAVGSAT